MTFLCKFHAAILLLFFSFSTDQAVVEVVLYFFVESASVLLPLATEFALQAVRPDPALPPYWWWYAAERIRAVLAVLVSYGWFAGQPHLAAAAVQPFWWCGRRFAT